MGGGRGVRFEGEDEKGGGEGGGEGEEFLEGWLVGCRGGGEVVRRGRRWLCGCGENGWRRKWERRSEELEETVSRVDY